MTAKDDPAFRPDLSQEVADRKRNQRLAISGRTTVASRLSKDIQKALIKAGKQKP